MATSLLARKVVRLGAAKTQDYLLRHSDSGKLWFDVWRILFADGDHGRKNGWEDLEWFVANATPAFIAAMKQYESDTLNNSIETLAESNINTDTLRYIWLNCCADDDQRKGFMAGLGRRHDDMTGLGDLVREQILPYCETHPVHFGGRGSWAWWRRNISVPASVINLLDYVGGRSAYKRSYHIDTIKFLRQKPHDYDKWLVRFKYAYDNDFMSTVRAIAKRTTISFIARVYPVGPYFTSLLQWVFTYNTRDDVLAYAYGVSEESIRENLIYNQTIQAKPQNYPALEHAMLSSLNIDNMPIRLSRLPFQAVQQKFQELVQKEKVYKSAQSLMGIAQFLKGQTTS